MNASTFERALRRLASRRPFRVFAIELVTKELLRIEHPEAMIVRNGMIYFFEPDAERRFFDSNSVVQLFSTARSRS